MELQNMDMEYQAMIQKIEVENKMNQQTSIGSDNQHEQIAPLDVTKVIDQRYYFYSLIKSLNLCVI